MELSSNCDFCFDPNVTHVLPARSFVAPLNMGSLGDWACCSVCANLIEKNRWPDLFLRVKNSWEVKKGIVMHPLAQNLIKNVYKRLRKNITGPVRPI